jgi:uncharacterized protein (TIGR02452 family)
VSLAGVAKETVAIVDRGEYTIAGRVVSIAAEVRAAIAGTVLYRPDDFETVPRPDAAVGGTKIEVWADTTAGAARRLVEVEGEREVAALNFASAKNPGGGFLGGAKAQEEDLARCSALYHCLRSQRGYYDANRAEASMLYTDHVIFSPAVPFFRDERLDLLPRPFLVGIVTAPAPNAGEHLRRAAGGRPAIRATLERRAERVLRVLAHRGQRVLVLGAWGCGVFRNEPAQVAEVFARLLTAPPYAGAFARVVFAIYDRSKDRATLRAFEQALT